MKLKHILIVFGVLLVVLGVLRAVTGVAPVNNRNYEIERMTYLAMIAEDAVLDKLKAPSTAEFPEYHEYDYRQSTEEQDVYYVLGYVDAQNSFGAMLRNDFVVKCRYVSPDDYELIGVELE